MKNKLFYVLFPFFFLGLTSCQQVFETSVFEFAARDNPRISSNVSTDKLIQLGIENSTDAKTSKAVFDALTKKDLTGLSSQDMASVLTIGVNASNTNNAVMTTVDGFLKENTLDNISSLSEDEQKKLLESVVKNVDTSVYTNEKFRELINDEDVLNASSPETLCFVSAVILTYSYNKYKTEPDPFEALADAAVDGSDPEMADLKTVAEKITNITITNTEDSGPLGSVFGDLADMISGIISK